MSKILDFIIFTAVWFLISYGILSNYLDKMGSILISLISYVGISALLLTLTKTKKSRGMRAEEMPVYLALMDRKEQTELFYNLVPESKRIGLNSPYFSYEDNGKIILVAVLYRFINLTQEDIASAYREGLKQGANEIVILTRYRERKTLTLTALLPLKFHFPDKYAVHRTLKKLNALPPKPNAPQKTKIKLSYRELIESVFNPKRTKYMLYISLMLALMS
ncbi:MAG: hypothetical protein IJ033_06365, partial [Clostridia bacterium]|nr:hypothetical protein [Clostridia bacterium]